MFNECLLTLIQSWGGNPQNQHTLTSVSLLVGQYTLGFSPGSTHWYHSLHISKMSFMTCVGCWKVLILNEAYLGYDWFF